MTFITRLKKVLAEEKYRTFLVFTFFAAVFSWVYMSINQFASLDDHFFHIRFAEMIRENGLDAFRNFHWLYFSNISLDQKYFIYYNFLFYLALIPFTLASPLFLGIKLYAIFSISLGFTILYFFLMKTGKRTPFLFLLLFLALINYSSIWRFLTTRPYALAPPLLLLELYFLHKRKYWAVFCLSLLYPYWHSVTFFFPLFIAGVFFLFHAFYEKKVDWKLVLSSLAGLIVALISMELFAPGFFYFIKDIYIGMFRDTLIGKRVNIAEGGELYPMDALNFVVQNLSIVVVFLAAIVFEVYNYSAFKKGDSTMDDGLDGLRDLRGALFFLSISFLLGTFLSKRNNDFLVFFLIPYLYLVLNLFLDHISCKGEIMRKSFSVSIRVLAVCLFCVSMLFIHEQISNTAPHNSIEGAAQWLNKNTKDGEIVFNASWNWFPTLFYYDQKNYYIAGIEPRFLYDYSHELYWKWWHISNDGYVCTEDVCEEMTEKKADLFRSDSRKDAWYHDEGELIADSIENDFKSRYIITAVGMNNLNDVLDHNDRFNKVFEDKAYKQYLVYEIVR